MFKKFSLIQSKPEANCPQPMTPAIQALTDIWLKNSNYAIQVIDIGTELWHCGRIPTSEHIENNNALWTTRNADHQNHYVGSAKSPNSFRPYQPTKLQLSTLRKLKAADFNTASLLDFTVQHCATNHQIMKETLRAWCVGQGLDAIVSINRGPDEVVIVYPADDLKIVNTVFRKWRSPFGTGQSSDDDDAYGPRSMLCTAPVFAKRPKLSPPMRVTIPIANCW